MANDLSAALRNLSLTDNDKNIFYLQQLATTKNQFFSVKWGGVCLKHFDAYGRLLDFQTKAEAATSVLKPWLYLPLKVFLIQVILFLK